MVTVLLQDSLTDIIIKTPLLVYFLVFSSMLKYKNFDFSFNGRLSLGNYVYNNVASNYGYI